MIHSTFFALIPFLILTSGAHAAAVHERECTVLEGDTARSVTVRSSEAQFKVIFETRSGEPQSVELADLKTEFSADRKVEIYRGRLSNGAFRRDDVILTIDGTRRRADGKSPAELKYKRFLFSKKLSAECSDWNRVPDAIF